MNTYTLGTAVKIEVTFIDIDGGLFDPPTVKLVAGLVGGTPTVYEYGVDPDVVRESLGVYYRWIVPGVAGEWCYQGKSTGTGQIVKEEHFEISEACFA